MPGIVLKIGLPLLIGLISLVAAKAGGLPGRNSLALAAVLAFGSALVLFIVDTEMRLSAVDERMAEGFEKMSRPAELPAMPDRSILDGALLTDLLQTASQSDEGVNPLLQRLARREMKRVTAFVRQLPVGSEITYDGEDRDWLLGLTPRGEASIDAISCPRWMQGYMALTAGCGPATWASVISTSNVGRSPGRSAFGASSCSRTPRSQAMRPFEG